MATTLDDAAEAIGAALLELLPHRGVSDERLIEFVEELGWTLPRVPPVLRELDGEALGGAVAKLTDARRRAADNDEITRLAVELTAALATFADTLQQIPARLRAELPAPFVAATHIDEQFHQRLLDQSVCRYVEARARYIVELAWAVGVAVIEEREARPESFQPAYTHRELHIARAMRLLADPRGVFEETLAWGRDSLLLDTLLAALLQVSIERDMPARYAYPPKALAGVPPPGPGLLVPLVDDPPFAITAGLFPGRSDAGKAGLLLLLAAEGLVDVTLPLPGNLSLELATTLLAPLVALRLHPDQPPELAAAPFDGTGVPVSGSLTATLRFGSETEQRSLLELGALKLAGRSVYLRAGLSRHDEISDAFVETGIEGGQLTLAIADDGVLGQLIPFDKLELDVDVGLGWSVARGTYFVGHVGLELTVPTDRRIGPASLTAFRFAIRVRDGALVATGAANGALALGPVTLTFAGLGVDITTRAGGRLGIADVDALARRPDRIGLAIEAPLVSGEGEIAFEREAQRYAGSLALQVGPVAVRAIGMLERSPGLSRPSLTVLATSQFPRIPLGYGFTLDGIGALLATERRIDVDAIRAGLRTGQLAALLGDSGDALAVLPHLFPPAQGRVAVGIYAKLGWGTPQVLDARLMPVFELPEPMKIVVLGTLELGLPTLEHRIIDLRIDAVGTLDLARRTLAIDASLHDSSIAGNPLTGDMALRLDLGDSPSMLLSIGGFHPRFQPPAGFPALRRIELTAGENPQLRLSAYVAVSFVSSQVGAHVDLLAKGGGFQIKAHLGFDALFELFPFHFDVELDVKAAISWHGHNLLGVHLNFLLSGPHPYHAKGSASFSVLWWDVSVGFDKTWGDAEPLPLPPPPDLAVLLRDALARADAWTPELAARARPLFALADHLSADALPPNSAIVVRQRVLPLDYGISMYGSVPLPAEQRFSIAHVRTETADVAAPPVDAPFAVGQFTKLSDDEKLSAPTFERFTAGVRIADDLVRTGSISRSAVDVDTITIDTLPVPDEAPRRVVLDGTLAMSFIALRAQTRPTAVATAPKLHDLKYVLVTAASLEAPAAAATTFANNLAMRRSAPALARAELQVVPQAHVATG